MRNLFNSEYQLSLWNTKISGSYSTDFFSLHKKSEKVRSVEMMKINYLQYLVFSSLVISSVILMMSSGVSSLLITILWQSFL